MLNYFFFFQYHPAYELELLGGVSSAAQGQVSRTFMEAQHHVHKYCRVWYFSECRQAHGNQVIFQSINLVYSFSLIYAGFSPGPFGCHTK